MFSLKVSIAACNQNFADYCTGIGCGCASGGMGDYCTNCSVGPTPTGAPDACFLPDTKIAMADGTYKNIQDLKVGDHVLSYDPPHHVLVDKYGNTTNVYADSQQDTNHKVINDDGTYTQYVYNSKWLNELWGTSINPPKSDINIIQRIKNKIVEKWEKITDYFTPVTMM